MLCCCAQIYQTFEDPSFSVLVRALIDARVRAPGSVAARRIFVPSRRGPAPCSALPGCVLHPCFPPRQAKWVSISMLIVILISTFSFIFESEARASPCPAALAPLHARGDAADTH